MTDKNLPGAHSSDRAGERVLCGTAPHTISLPYPQRHATSCRIVGWKVSKSLTVDSVEVAHA